MPTARKIDRLPAKPRAKDVEVLVLGFSRTGTFCKSLLPRSAPSYDLNH